jgi:uncharacterized protein YbjT (DUF2867 family)
MSRTILVTAATGSLGKPLALELVKIGWKVRTTTRDPSSPVAQELAKAGVEVLKGTWDDDEVLRTAMSGCDGLFMNLMPDFTDFSADVRWGRKILALAKSFPSIKHVIFSSSVAPDKPELLNYYNPESLIARFLNNKRIVEEATKEGGFEAWTILRPTGFMSNWVTPKVASFAGLAETGTWTTPLDPDTPMAFIDEKDAAQFAIAAFKNPARFNGKEIVVSSVLVPVEEVIQTLRRVTGKDLKANYLPEKEALKKAKEENNWMMESQVAAKTMYRFVDMDEVKAWGIPLHSFEDYLKREKESVDKTYGHLS